MDTDETIGPGAIRDALKTIPDAAGVYRMLDATGTVLYVGKAKHLPSRLLSYTTGSTNTRTASMVAQIARVEVVVTRNEAEALLVEAAQIRRERPHYNILLKDDKSHPFLLITEHAFPRITKHRGAQSMKGAYFGPFAHVGACNQTLTLLQKVFQLRPCSDTFFKNRNRPCLQYQIKRCSAPCVNYITEAAYGEQVRRARDFLKGRHRDLQEELAAQMAQASAAQEYELAAALRDRIRDLTQVQQEQSLYAHGLTDADVVALARRGATSAIQCFFYRDGRHFGHQTYYPRHDESAQDGEIMAAFLSQFYQTHAPPEMILVNTLPEEAELLMEALSATAGARVTLLAPQRGDKRQLLDHITENAQGALDREAGKRAATLSMLARIQELFSLVQPPQRIEVYDNSHLMGSHALGAMIVATADGFEKRSYRHFTMKQAATDDDYGMMREMFTRRFARIVKEGRAPDLILIDGGKGQLSAVESVMRAAGLSLPLVAIAKGQDRNAGREWFFQPGREPFQLALGDPRLHYLETLRDEAHRYAISRHRKKRSTAISVSALDDIPGVGFARKRALLVHFGSRDAIAVATLAELTKVDGISKKTAKVIFDYFARG
jgi:excinuclease ABC subunit C